MNCHSGRFHTIIGLQRSSLMHDRTEGRARWEGANRYLPTGGRNSLLVRAPDSYRKVASSNPGRSGRRSLFSRVNFVCWLLFGVRSTSGLPRWHIKDPGHSAKKSAGVRLHLNTHTPMTQRSRTGLTMSLSGHSVGTYPETSSHATCQGTFDHGRLSSLSHGGLILA